MLFTLVFRSRITGGEWKLEHQYAKSFMEVAKLGEQIAINESMDSPRSVILVSVTYEGND